jgi:hypothetical protein
LFVKSLIAEKRKGFNKKNNTKSTFSKNFYYRRTIPNMRRSLIDAFSYKHCK